MHHSSGIPDDIAWLDINDPLDDEETADAIEHALTHLESLISQQLVCIDRGLVGTSLDTTLQRLQDCCQREISNDIYLPPLSLEWSFSTQAIKVIEQTATTATIVNWVTDVVITRSFDSILPVAKPLSLSEACEVGTDLLTWLGCSHICEQLAYQAKKDLCVQGIRSILGSLLYKALAFQVVEAVINTRQSDAAKDSTGMREAV